MAETKTVTTRSDPVARRWRTPEWSVFGVAMAAYLTATLLQVLPLLGDLSHRLPSDPGDPVLNAWILWWDAHAWPLTMRWWNAPAFYPAAGVLSFSEHLLGIAFFTAPIQWLSGSPVLAYNLAFIASFPLSAGAMYLLVRDLTGRHDVAFVAGAAYGFSPYRVAQIAHLQMLFSFWLPLALLGLHAGLRGRRWGFPAAAACWLMQGLANGYLLLFFPVLAAFWLLWFTASRPRLLARAVGWFAAAGILVLPFLLGYLRYHNTYSFARSPAEIARFSADVSAVFASSRHLKLWDTLLKPAPEGELFPGFVILALASLAAVWTAWSTRIWTMFRLDAVQAPLVRRFRLAMAGAALVWGLLAVASWATGGFAIPLGFTSIPVVNPTKPFELALLAAGIYRLTGLRRGTTSHVDRVMAFYVLGAILSFLLCLGPSPTFMGRPFWHGPIKAPYALLLMLPGYDGLRVPARFGLLFVMCLAIAGALFLARLLPKRPAGWAAAVLLGGFVIAEGWAGPIPVVPSPLNQPAPWMDSVAGARAVLELPMKTTRENTAAMLRSTAYDKPVLDGYSGYLPPTALILQSAIRQDDIDALEALGAEGPIAVVLHTTQMKDGALEAQFDASPDFVRRGEWADTRLYWFRAPAAPIRPVGPSLPIAHLRASPRPDEAQRMIDGRLETRWATNGPQRGGESVTVDLGTSHAVGSIVLDLGSFAGDYPRLLQVDVSEDGVVWTAGFRSSTSGLAMQGALRTPRSVPIILPVRAQARYIRLTQLGSDDRMYWSIAELSVHAPAMAP
jgi:hypothetical protein